MRLLYALLRLWERLKGWYLEDWDYVGGSWILEERRQSSKRGDDPAPIDWDTFKARKF